ncbi:MAG: hypothetical protein QXV22_00870 [Thermoplasmataceae archaeon]
MSAIGFMGPASKMGWVLRLVSRKYVVAGAWCPGGRGDLPSDVRIYDEPFQLGADCSIIFKWDQSSGGDSDSIFGPQGLIHTLQSGSIIVEFNPRSLKAVTYAYSKLAETGIHYLDAATFGVPQSDHNWIAIISGSNDSFGVIEPVLRDAFKEVSFVGHIGTSTKMSFASRMIEAVNLIAFSEALAVCMRSGIQKETAINILSKPEVIRQSDEYIRRKLVDEKFDPVVKLGEYIDNLENVEDFISSSQSSALLFTLSRSIFESAKSIGLSNLDYTSVFRAVKRIGGFL